MDDWRLIDQDKYLMNSYLVKIHFVPEENIDHMHCAFCWDKISDCDGDLHVGYIALDGMHIVCEQCFRDFCDRFHWKVLQSKEDVDKCLKDN